MGKFVRLPPITLGYKKQSNTVSSNQNRLGIIPGPTSSVDIWDQRNPLNQIFACDCTQKRQTKLNSPLMNSQNLIVRMKK